jgi:hypothetical protein
LLAVGGVAGNDLWAVGQHGADENVTGVPPGSRTLTEHWNGTSWSVVPSPNVGDQDTLTGAAANSTAAVAAVGSFAARNATALVRQTVALEWNGTSWVTQTTPNVGTADNLLPGGAAVPGTGTVWAVGLFVTIPPSRFRFNTPLILKGASG